MIKQKNLIAVAYSFLSYVFRSTDKILEVYLFGSVARNDFDKDSDIDLFISVEKKDEKSTQKVIDRALKNFYSSLEYEKWSLKGIKNEISIKLGYLPEWKLKKSLEYEGIILYATSFKSGFKKTFLVSFKPIKSPAKRMRVIRKLFGRKEKGYLDKGMINELNGKVLGSNTFMITKGLQEITRFLAKEKIQFKLEEIWN